MTLLEVVQQILSDMDGDEVNSISDTEESEQVARNVVRTFENLVSNREWLHTKSLIQLTSLSDLDFPTYFTTPDNMAALEFLAYNKAKLTSSRKLYEEVCWKEPDDFLRYVNMRDSGASSVQTVVDPSGVELFILNNQSPSYYTSFNDKTIIMDSFDNEVDTTLQESKTQARGVIIPSLSLNDNAVIDLPREALSLLIEKATARSQMKVRQIKDTESEEEAARQNRWLSRKNWKIKGGIRYRDYGRKR